MNQNDISILQEVLDCDTIPMEVLEAITNMKIAKVKEIHKYAITKTNGKETRWQTYIKTDSTRKKVSANTEKALYLKLYEHYYGTDMATVESLYPEWLIRRKSSNLSPRTIKRYEQYWEKYYRNSDIILVPIDKLKTDDIERFLYECIRKFSMNKKALDNMKFVIADILKMAKRKNLIIRNPMDEVEIKSYSCAPSTRYADSSRVYCTEEKEAMFREIQKEIHEYPNNTDCYAILLLFKLGLRIGEICALKWSDMGWDSGFGEIHIRRTESQELDSDGKLRPVVLEHTKKKSPYGDRFLPLGEYELNILRTVKQINTDNGYYDDDYIFCDENGRTKIREIDNRIRKLCTHANIPIKSAHDIRRTVASEMHMNGVPIKIIQKYLGHSDISTTWGYIYNTKNKQETSDLILGSLQNMNSLQFPIFAN